MIVKRTRFWWLRRYKWKIFAPQAYDCQRIDDQGQYFRQILKQEYFDWLINTPADMLMFKQAGIVTGFRMVAVNGKLRLCGKPPPILFRRKSDIVLFKLTFGNV
jgi:hypothetical protein